MCFEVRKNLFPIDSMDNFETIMPRPTGLIRWHDLLTFSLFVCRLFDKQEIYLLLGTVRESGIPQDMKQNAHEIRPKVSFPNEIYPFCMSSPISSVIQLWVERIEECQKNWDTIYSYYAQYLLAYQTSWQREDSKHSLITYVQVISI